MSEFQKFVDDLLRSMYARELEILAEREFKVRPDWKGFAGILQSFGEWTSPVPVYTPVQFNRMWGRLSRKERIAYVRACLREKT